MVNKNEEIIRKKYEEKGYKVLRNGAPDFVMFKYDEGTKKFSNVKFIEVKAGNDRLSYEQEIYFMLLKSLGLDCKVEYIKKIKSTQNNFK